MDSKPICSTAFSFAERKHRLSPGHAPESAAGQRDKATFQT